CFTAGRLPRLARKSLASRLTSSKSGARKISWPPSRRLRARCKHRRGQGSATSARGRGLAHWRTQDAGREEILSRQPARHGGSPRRRLKPGTVLVRDYQGQRHTVTVVCDGFDWQGATYQSLSAIARAITGTAWSGPRFFALARGKSCLRQKAIEWSTKSRRPNSTRPLHVFAAAAP